MPSLFSLCPPLVMLATRRHKPCWFKFILSFPIRSSHISPLSSAGCCFAEFCYYNLPVTHLAGKISLPSAIPVIPVRIAVPGHEVAASARPALQRLEAGEQRPSVRHRGSEGSTTQTQRHTESSTVSAGGPKGTAAQQPYW